MRKSHCESSSLLSSFLGSQFDDPILLRSLDISRQQEIICLLHSSHHRFWPPEHHYHFDHSLLESVCLGKTGLLRPFWWEWSILLSAYKMDIYMLSSDFLQLHLYAEFFVRSPVFWINSTYFRSVIKDNKNRHHTKKNIVLSQIVRNQS